MKRFLAFLLSASAAFGATTFTTPEVVTNIARGEAYSILGSITNGGGGGTNIIIVTNVLPSNLITQFQSGVVLTGIFNGMLRGGGAGITNVQPSSANLTNWSLIPTNVLGGSSLVFNNTQFNTNSQVSIRKDAAVTNLYTFGTHLSSSGLPNGPYVLFNPDGSNTLHQEFTINLQNSLGRIGPGPVLTFTENAFIVNFGPNYNREDYYQFSPGGGQFSYPVTIGVDQTVQAPQDQTIVTKRWVEYYAAGHRAAPTNLAPDVLTNGILMSRDGTNYWSLDGSAITNISVNLTNLAGIVTNNSTGVTLAGDLRSSGLYPLILTNSAISEGLIVGIGSDGSTNTAARWDSSNRKLVITNATITGTMSGTVSGTLSGTGTGITGVNGATDAGSIPLSHRLSFPTAVGNVRGTVHPNAVWFPTNWNGAQIWLALTGTTNQSVTAGGTGVEDPFVFKSSDGGNTWTASGPQPLLSREDSCTLAGWSTNGWQADTELYFDPAGYLRLLWMGYHQYAAGVSNVLFSSYTSDGSTWSTPVVLRKWFTDVGFPWSTNAAMAGPQVVTVPDGTLRLYYVDDGNYGTNGGGVGIGTNVLAYVTGNDTSGTNWNWTNITFCTLQTYLPNTSAPWHMDIAVVNSNDWRIQYGSQATSLGEYSTSTDGINWAPAGAGLWTDIVRKPEEGGIYKATWSQVAGPNGTAFDAIVGLTATNQSQILGWNFALVRNFQPDPAKLTYTGVNTNWMLVGAEKGYSGANRVGTFTIVDKVSGGVASTAGLGSPFSGWAALALGWNSPMAATNFVLASDGVTQTRLNARGSGLLAFSLNNTVKSAITTTNFYSDLPFTGSGSGLTNLPVMAVVAGTNVTATTNNGVITLNSSAASTDGVTNNQSGVTLSNLKVPGTLLLTNTLLHGGVELSGRSNILDVNGIVSAVGFHGYVYGNQVSGNSSTATDVPLLARGAAAQSTNLMEWQDSTSNVVAAVSSAGTFTGNGSGLTNLQAAQLTGTLPMGTLTAQSPVVTNGFLTTDGSARSYSRDGSPLTNLNASALSSGTVDPARLTATLSQLSVSNGNVRIDCETNSPTSFKVFSSASTTPGIFVRPTPAGNYVGINHPNPAYSLEVSGIARMGTALTDTWQQSTAADMVVNNTTSNSWTRFRNVGAGQVGMGNLTVTNTVTASNVVASSTVTATNFTVILTNRTGSNSVAGQIVEMAHDYDFAVHTADAGSKEPIGVVLDGGVANGAPMRIVTSGFAPVLIETNLTAVGRSYWIAVSDTQPGRAQAQSSYNALNHDQEVGHSAVTNSYSAGPNNTVFTLIHIGR